MTTTIQQGSHPATHPPRPPAPLKRQDSVELLLAATKRKIIPIRKYLVQRGHGATTKPGLLATFLKSHDERGLEAYLFLHGMASASKPHDCVLPSATWVRVLGLGEDATEDSARSAVSKVMKRLEDRNLVTRGRRNRKAVITLLREDGLGEPFARPQGHTRSDRWFQLPHTYWTEGHYLNLSLPAKIVLLIALTRPDGFQLPEHKGPDWYGVSPDSIGTGLRELEAAGLLLRDFEWISAPRSESGWTQRHLYTLLGSFSTAERKKAARARGSDSDEGDPDIPDLVQETP